MNEAPPAGWLLRARRNAGVEITAVTRLATHEAFRELRGERRVDTSTRMSAQGPKWGHGLELAAELISGRNIPIPAGA
jgi:hypothetical protein